MDTIYPYSLITARIQRMVKVMFSQVSVRSHGGGGRVLQSQVFSQVSSPRSFSRRYPSLRWRCSRQGGTPVLNRGYPRTGIPSSQGRTWIPLDQDRTGYPHPGQGWGTSPPPGQDSTGELPPPPPPARTGLGSPTPHTTYDYIRHTTAERVLATRRYVSCGHAEGLSGSFIDSQT